MRIGPAAALAVLACAPRATPPPPDPEVVRIEERAAAPDSDRLGPLGVPEPELPRPGECRVWDTALESAEQRPAEACGKAESGAPPGSVVLYRPPEDTLVVHARRIHPEQPGTVLRVDLYEAEAGTYLGTKVVEDGAAD